MPHFDVQIHEDALGGDDSPLGAQLIKELTAAATRVYGESFRELVVVELFGTPRGRWGVGGVPTDEPAPVVTLRSREGIFTDPRFEGAAAQLISGATDAVVAVFGEEIRQRTTVRLVGVPAGRTGVGGELA
jgi:phenylpyruvate tautomerase PptA (4-oxalocrotonate tautomerase family)